MISKNPRFRPNSVKIFRVPPLRIFYPCMWHPQYTQRYAYRRMMALQGQMKWSLILDYVRGHGWEGFPVCSQIRSRLVLQWLFPGAGVSWWNQELRRGENFDNCPVIFQWQVKIGRHRWMESACYPERRHRRRGQGRGRRLVAAWLGPALLLPPPSTGRTQGTTFTHTSTGRTPGHHLLTQLATRSRRPYSIHPSYSAALEASLRKGRKCMNQVD